MSLAQILGVPKALIGMVHLGPLPGSPRWGGSMGEIIDRALEDARVLEAGGLDALLVENYGDVPFTAGHVDAATVAAMTAVIGDIRQTVADGAIVGTSLKRDGRLANPVDPDRVRRFVEALRGR